jgi:hypothetical protein
MAASSGSARYQKEISPLHLSWYSDYGLGWTAEVQFSVGTSILFFTDRFFSQPNLIYSGYQAFFFRGKATGA